MTSKQARCVDTPILDTVLVASIVPEVCCAVDAHQEIVVDTRTAQRYRDFTSHLARGDSEEAASVEMPE